MKALILVTSLSICGTAIASDPPWIAAQTVNGSGGITTLTSRQDKNCDGEWSVVIANSANGLNFGGCWRFMTANVEIAWQDGDSRLYPTASFKWSDWIQKKDPAPAAPVPKIEPKANDTQT